MFLPVFLSMLMQRGWSACSGVTTYSGTQVRLSLSSSSCLRLTECRFINIKPGSQQFQGGAIFFSPLSSGSGSLEINATHFSNCEIGSQRGDDTSQGGAIFATCQVISTFRTCFEECAALEEAHVLYAQANSGTDVRSHVLCTFYYCGFPSGSNSEGTGTILLWTGSRNSASSFTVENANWTSNRAYDDHGSLFYSDLSTAVVSWRYVTCVDNRGTSALDSPSSSGWPNARSAWDFQYVNVIDCQMTPQSGSSYVIWFGVARGNFEHCVFDNGNTITLCYPGQGTIRFADCAANNGFPTFATNTRNYAGVTATIDAKVPYRVCLVPPGSPTFTPSNELRQTSEFTGSDVWKGTNELTSSRGIDVSQGIGRSRI
jgi:hypothetical protein